MPKTKYFSRKRVEYSVAAVTKVNFGKRVAEVERLGDVGKAIAEKIGLETEKVMEKREGVKQERIQKRRKKLEEEKMKIREEGITYEAGGGEL